MKHKLDGQDLIRSSEITLAFYCVGIDKMQIGVPTWGAGDRFRVWFDDCRDRGYTEHEDDQL